MRKSRGPFGLEDRSGMVGISPGGPVSEAEEVLRCLIDVIDNDGFIYAKILKRIDPTEGKPGGIYPPEGPAPMQVQASIPVPPLTGPSGQYQQMMSQQPDPNQMQQPVVPQPPPGYPQPQTPQGWYPQPGQQVVMPQEPQAWSQPQQVMPMPPQQAPAVATQSPV